MLSLLYRVYGPVKDKETSQLNTYKITMSNECCVENMGRKISMGEGVLDL